MFKLNSVKRIKHKSVISGVIVVLIVLCLSPVAYCQYGSDLNILIPNIKTIKGSFKICLVNSKLDYLKNCFQEKNVFVTDDRLRVTFENIPVGEYVITLFHDQNNDGKLNTNFIGIPKEPYGFSNNPMSIFGPPNYKKCIFQVEGDKTIEVKL